MPVQNPSQRKTLFLAAGEAYAVLAEIGPEATGPARCCIPNLADLLDILDVRLELAYHAVEKFTCER
ncbi:hypothetical protein ACWTU6_29150 [Mesorhizobium sp. BHbsci]